jgi:lipopolysaccharide export system protein LptA
MRLQAAVTVTEVNVSPRQGELVLAADKDTVTLEPAEQAESATSNAPSHLGTQRSVQASKDPCLTVQAASWKRATVCCPGKRGRGGGGGT